MVIFGIIVPTGDNYSDLWLSMRFFSGTYDPAGLDERDCTYHLNDTFTIDSTGQTFICDFFNDCIGYEESWPTTYIYKWHSLHMY